MPIDHIAIREARLQAVLQGLLRRRLAEDYCDEDLPLPSAPTLCQVGSRAKIEVMRKRAERGESVFHPRDSPLIELP